MNITVAFAAIAASGLIFASPAKLAGQSPRTVQRHVLPAPDRVVLRALNADVEVRTSEDDSVRIEVGGPAGGVRLEPERTGGELELHERWPAREATRRLHYRITLPPRVEVELWLATGNVDVAGVLGRTQVRVAEGSIAARRLRGHIDLSAVTGGVTLVEAEGSIAVRSVAGGIKLTRVTGSVRARSTSGSVDVSSEAPISVDAESYSGAVTFSGSLAPNAVSVFATNSGPIQLRLAPGASATISARSVRGRVSERCDRLRPGSSDDRYVVGTAAGAPSVDVISFSGNIDLACVAGGRR